MQIEFKQYDALLVIDVQNDFLPGGALAVPVGDEVIDPLNRYAERMAAVSGGVWATRDWHPEDHCSFTAQGGLWPPHCVQDTAGAAFSPLLRLPEGSVVVSKATEPDVDHYSGFGGTDLHEQLQANGVKRVFVGGLATDYCVLNTVKDALKLGYQTLVLLDGIRAVDVNPGDGQKAIDEMIELGATAVRL